MNAMHLPRCLLVLLALSLSGSRALQASAAAVPGTALAAAQTAPVTAVRGPAAYVLGSGDQLTIRVQDMDEIPDRPLRVDPDGGLDLPLIGRVQAAGLTLGQFRAELVAKLSRFITDPQVSANVVDNQSRSVSVIGEVNAPGVHQLTGPRHLIEVISEAGGVKADAGPRVVITREMANGPLPLPAALTDETGRYSTASVSLDDLMASKTPAQNIVIQPNDVISVPKGDVVYVMGAVNRPGGFPLDTHPSISLLQAVSLAQGTKPDAAMGSAKILRQKVGGDGTPTEIPVNVKQIVAGKAPDVPLHANDILLIPNSAAKSGSRRAMEAVLQVATGVIIYGR